MGFPLSPQLNSTTVPVNPHKYEGKWYEVAKYPNVFETGCSTADAEYRYDSLKKGFHVKNTCYGKKKKVIRSLHGWAEETKITNNFSLSFQVGHHWTPASSYYILWTDYKLSIVGSLNDPTVLWVLSREKKANHKKIDALVRSVGYDPSRLKYSY